jgi:hypothetical protein
LADKGFSNTTIEELLKNVKKVEETYWQTANNVI